MDPSQRGQIEARALAIAADLDRTIGPFTAEIYERATPCWHIVKTQPGRETVAADHLEKRCFGIFLPRFVAGSRMTLSYADRMTGRQRHELIDLSDRLIFPGKIFIFCWDILAHWRRILDCPGVTAIMCAGNEKPVVLKDEQVNRIRVLQHELSVRHKRKRRKRYRSAQDRIVISPVSHWK